MKRVKKDDPVASKIRELRNKIKQEVESKISREYAEARQAGKFPWEGMWLRPQEIGKVQSSMKKKDRAVFVEVIFLFFIMTVVSLFLLMLINGFIPKKNGVNIRPYLDFGSQPDSHSSGLADTRPISRVNQNNINTAESDIKESTDKQITKNEIRQAAAPRTGKVAINVLRLRDGPGVHYPIILRLKYGASITVRDTDGEWMKVVTDKLITGWVFGEYIELDAPERKKDFSHDKGTETLPDVTSAGADADKTGNMNNELHAFEKEDMPVIYHKEGIDETSGLQASESNQQKLSRRSAAGDKELIIQVGAWKNPAYAQNVFKKLKEYYPEVRIIKDNDLSKVVIPDVETEKQAYVIQHKLARRFNLSPILSRTKHITEKKVDKEETAEVSAGRETSSPGLNSESAEDAETTSDQVITDRNLHSVDARQNVIPGIALIVKTKMDQQITERK